MLLMLNTTAANPHITPMSEACQIDEWNRTRPGYENVPVHGCMSDMDCQGKRTCSGWPHIDINQEVNNVGWCTGAAGLACCGVKGDSYETQCPTMDMLNSLPGGAANADWLAYGDIRTRLFFPYGDTICNSLSKDGLVSVQRTLGMGGDEFKRDLDKQCMPCYSLYNDGDTKPSDSCFEDAWQGWWGPEVPYTTDKTRPTGYNILWPEAGCWCAAKRKLTLPIPGFHPSTGSMFGKPMPPPNSNNLYSYVCTTEDEATGNIEGHDCSTCRPQPILVRTPPPPSSPPPSPATHSPAPCDTSEWAIYNRCPAAACFADAQCASRYCEKEDGSWWSKFLGRCQ